jgi:hypothetical protein
VFHQVKQSIGEADNMEANDWGWSIEHNMCVPIRSSLPPAPDELTYIDERKWKISKFTKNPHQKN